MSAAPPTGDHEHDAAVLIRLDPRCLQNPDADIRYSLPKLLVDVSGGLLRDDGYEYVGDAPYLVIYLSTRDPERSLACALRALGRELVHGNAILDAAVIAVERVKGDAQSRRIVFPSDFVGAFIPTADDSRS